MTESRRILGSDLKKSDAHQIAHEEYEEIPELTDEWFDQAEFAVGAKVVRAAKRPGRPRADRIKKLIALRIDPDIIEGFRATGPGWQSRINAALREYLQKTCP
jgi:uncharacterized protein (DUF4415 family)